VDGSGMLSREQLLIKLKYKCSIGLSRRDLYLIMRGFKQILFFFTYSNGNIRWIRIDISLMANIITPGYVYLIQHYVIKFVSVLLQVGGFLGAF